MERYVPIYTNLGTSTQDSRQNPHNDSTSYRDGYQRGIRHNMAGQNISSESFSNFHPDVNNLAFYNMPILPQAQNPFQTFSTIGRDYGTGNLINISSTPATVYSNPVKTLTTAADMTSQFSPCISETSNIHLPLHMPKPRSSSSEPQCQLHQKDLTQNTSSAKIIQTEGQERIKCRSHSKDVAKESLANSAENDLSFGPQNIEKVRTLENKADGINADSKKHMKPVQTINSQIKNLTDTGTGTTSERDKAQDNDIENTDLNDLNEMGVTTQTEKECGDVEETKLTKKKQGDVDRTTDGVKQELETLAKTDEILQVFPFVCGFCTTKFTKVVNYYEHFKTHKEMKSEHFHVCKNVISVDKESSLTENAINDLYCCGLCQRTFLSVCQLHHHLINEEQVDKYVMNNETKTVSQYCAEKDVGQRPLESITTSAQLNKNISDTGNSHENDFSLSKVLRKKIHTAGKCATMQSKSEYNSEDSMVLTIKSKKRGIRKLNKLKKKRVSLEERNCTEVEVSNDSASASSKSNINSVAATLPGLKDPLNHVNGSDCKTIDADTSLKKVDTYIVDDELRVFGDKSDIEDDILEEQELDEDFIKSENDIERFIEIEKHQLKLQKKRKYYKERVERMKLVRKQNAEEQLEIEIVNDMLLDNTNGLSNGVIEENSETVNQQTPTDSLGFVDEKSRTCHVKKKPGPKPETKFKKAKFDESGKRIYAGDVMVPCYVCGQMYKKRHLLKHAATHAETRDFECDLCNKAFKTKSQLHNHKTNHVTEKNFVCEHCGKPFKTKANLRQHRKTHTAVRDIQCPLCPELFNNKYILRAHMCRHSDVKAHICEICGRGFKRIDQLTRHRYMHSEDRPYPCNMCGKPFKTKRDQMKHEKIHQPFGFFCQYCNKGFVNSHNMKIHTKTHLKSGK